MKIKIYVVLEDYNNGASYEEERSHYGKYINTYPTQQEAYEAICDLREEQNEEAKEEEDFYMPPTPMVKKEYTWKTVYSWKRKCDEWVEKWECSIHEKEMEIPI